MQLTWIDWVAIFGFVVWYLIYTYGYIKHEYKDWKVMKQNQALTEYRHVVWNMVNNTYDCCEYSAWEWEDLVRDQWKY